MISVLLVDDHPIVRAGYRRLLDQDGGIVVCEECANGMQAYEAYGRWNPDVTITDLTMPGGGGLELLRRIVQLHSDAKVVVCSMHDAPHLVQSALQGGATAYVSKNASPDHLLAAVYAAHRGQRYLSDPPLAATAPDFDDETRCLATLTLREMEVFRLLAMGHSVLECANQLYLSQKTVANNQTVLKEKLGVSTSTALVHLAQRHGIISTYSR